HEGRSWAHYGRFIKLERGRAIEHTWVSEATKGLESIVSVTLVPRDGGTEVTLRHTNVPDDEAGSEHRNGWAWYLDVLNQRFEKVAARGGFEAGGLWDTVWGFLSVLTTPS